MSFHVLSPPAGNEEFAKVGKEIWHAARKMGLTRIEPEGFLKAWIEGVRVLVERDKTGETVGMAFVVYGRRWVHSDYAATIIEMKPAPTEPQSAELLEFIRTIGRALGAAELIYESRQLTETTFEIIKERLQ